jgi:hypothetical protein
LVHFRFRRNARLRHTAHLQQANDRINDLIEWRSP